jgi:hypothetical protein
LQIQTNPWSFVAADQATSVAITSIASNGYSSLVTTTGAHGLVLNQNISLQAITGNPLYNNGYKVLSIPSTTTFLIAQNIPNLAASGANGNVLTVAYPLKVRIEQLSWQGAAAGTLTVTDNNGNIIWQQVASGADQTYTYGKLYWVDGIVLNALPSGIVIVTIN